VQKKSRDISKSTKRPSRKYRRRPNNLLLDYVRRQRKNIWLETHLWHAKRFHMVDLWGYRLPMHPNDKSIKASHRAINQHCLIQDMSYMRCIEICGPRSAIVSGMERLTPLNSAAGIGSAAYIIGSREGHVFLYTADHDNPQALGPSSFMWQPSEVSINKGIVSEENSISCLWLWVHPGMHDSVLQQIMLVYCLTESNATGKHNEKQDDTNHEQHSQLNCIKTTIEGTNNTKNICQNVDPRTVVMPLVQFSNGTITVSLLKDSLCRFRLSGPQAHDVLAAALQYVDIPPSPILNDDVGNTSLCADYCYENDLSCLHQKKVWEDMKGLKSPAELPSHVILALNIKDPRLNLPQKKTLKPKMQISQSETFSNDWLLKWPSTLSQSAIWFENIRGNVKTRKQSDHELNLKRAADIVPDSHMALSDKGLSCIPILLLQQPGQQPQHKKTSSYTSQPGYGCGWDIILPSGWGISMWVSLIYRGARAGGLREGQALANEAGCWNFPSGYPDTKTGQIWENEYINKLKVEYVSKPPAKRSNYERLGCPSPLEFHWSKLAKEWQHNLITARSNTDDDNMDIKYCEETESMSAAIPKAEDYVILPADTFSVLRNTETLQSLQALCKRSTRKTKEMVQPQHILENTEDNVNILVPVYVYMLNRGTPDLGSYIYFPTSGDMNELDTCASHIGPMEKCHSKCSNITKSIRYLCSREIFGKVKHGGFSLSHGKGTGMGFVALHALCKLLDEQIECKDGPMVLIRSQQSLQYRWAKLSIVTNIM